ncbi:phage major capsid protein [Hirschia litorea]|uniref:Phage major capsid protein n=1 Tax=Hirschia litorea TaxID=1199156 RepID=A0ABW2IIZ5_9PROT
MTLETKMGAATNVGANEDLRAVSAQIMTAFEALKETNDARLADIEKRGAADPLFDEKLGRIEAALDKQQARLDRISLDASRPAVGKSGLDQISNTEHKSAWDGYMRSGDDSGIARLDTKALSQGSDAQGGYVAPAELDRLIEARLQAASPMRQIASVRQTSAMVFKKPVGMGTQGSWAGETAARGQTTSPELELLEFPAAELYAMPAATQTLLDDAYADIDEWLADEVETAFSAQESAAFITGDGVNKPKGFLSYSIEDNASHAWGKIGSVSSGASGDFSATAPADALIDLIYAPKAQFRANGRFVMNRRTLSDLRKLKDSNGQYAWRPGVHGEGASIMGYGVTEIEDMPDIGAGNAAIAFGDFRKGYLIVDRQGARVLRDPYSAKPYVLFYTTKRVGGGVQNFDAIKVMTF